MYQEMILEDIRKCTVLPGLPAGRVHSVSPDGQMIGLFGLDHAPVSPTAKPGLVKGKKTSAICGRNFPGSSESVALQSALENRSKQRLDTGGSIEYLLSWKRRFTPAGRSYCQLAAKARPTNAIGSSGWPTTQTRDWKGPQGRAYKHEAMDLPATAFLACGDRKDEPLIGPTNKLLGREVWASGQIPNGSLAQTTKRGVLNPAFSLWLMGFPTVEQTPSWNTSSPNWEHWDMIQKLLEAWSRKHDQTASDG